MSADTTRRLISIANVADELAKMPDGTNRAMVMMAGAAYFLARKYGTAIAANSLYELGESYADQIVDKWKPPAKRRTAP